MKLLLGDCLDKLKELDNNSIDHIITDWPFYGVVKEDWDNQWNNLDEYLDWAETVIRSRTLQQQRRNRLVNCDCYQRLGWFC